jgi:hypothetical protein
MTYQPQFISVSITPNPCVVGETLLLSIGVIDAELVPQTVAPYSGEIYSGER